MICNKIDADLEIIHSSIVDSKIKYTLLYHYYKIKKESCILSHKSYLQNTKELIFDTWHKLFLPTYPFILLLLEWTHFFGIMKALMIEAIQIQHLWLCWFFLRKTRNNMINCTKKISITLIPYQMRLLIRLNYQNPEIKYETANWKKHEWQLLLWKQSYTLFFIR